MLAPIGALHIIFLLFHSAHPHSVINKTLLTVLLSRFKTTETNSQIRISTFKRQHGMMPIGNRKSARQSAPIG